MKQELKWLNWKSISEELYREVKLLLVREKESGNEPKGNDFEIWDERYKPESPNNEIDLYVALR